MNFFIRIGLPEGELQMNTFLGLCLVIITAAITALVIYLIQVLIQLKKATESMDKLIKKVSVELENVEDTIETISNVSRTIGKFGTPVISALGLIMGILKGVNIVRNKKNKGKGDDDK